jgi:hypothetical protein
MQIAGKRVWDILAEHGWSSNPEGHIHPFFVEQAGDKLYVDYPVRIYLTPLNSPTGTVGLDATEVRELRKDEFSKAEARRSFYPKISPWPKRT